MSIARVTEISATSTKSFEDAVEQGVARAAATLRNVKSAWIKEQSVTVDGDKISALPGEHDGDVRSRRLIAGLGGERTDGLKTREECQT